MNAKLENKIAKAGLWLIGFFILALLAAFLGYILYQGLPVLSFHFIFGQSSDIMAGGGVGGQLFNSFYMLLIALLLAFLGSGATEIASKCKLNDYASDMIIGIILFFILASEFFINYRLVFRKHAKEEA